MAVRKGFEHYERLPSPDPWFEVYRLPGDVFALCEPHHWQEVISFLVPGRDRALLLDTGMGIGDIRRVVRALTGLPVRAVNTHCHFDHVGGNHQFDDVWAFDWPESLARIRRGYSREELRPHGKPGLFSWIPEGFDPSDYRVQPSEVSPLKDGHVFDLGGRMLEVIHTPGHSPDSIMLLERAGQRLFTGDTYYPGHLYAHYEGAVYGRSDLNAYADTLERLCPLVGSLEVVHPSHNLPEMPPDRIPRVAEALRLLAEGKAPEGRLLGNDLSIASLPDRDEAVDGYVIPDALYVYSFDGFSVIAPCCHHGSSTAPHSRQAKGITKGVEGLGRGRQR